MDRLSVRLQYDEFAMLDKLDGDNRTDKIRTAIRLATKYLKKKGAKHDKKRTSNHT